MKVAVIQFPGSNCDQDALYSLRNDISVQAEYVWHDETSLDGYDAVFVPGGFTYGDYLRVGAIAGRASIITSLKSAAENGMPIIGVCNGFQILCETGILEGCLMGNLGERYICQNVNLKAETNRSIWTENVNSVLSLPIAHGEGRFFCDDDTLKELEDHEMIAFRYVDEKGELTEKANINGSVGSIAGILNKKGNVLGMMPHPERATSSILGGTDGKAIISALNSVTKVGF